MDGLVDHVGETGLIETQDDFFGLRMVFGNGDTDDIAEISGEVDGLVGNEGHIRGDDLDHAVEGLVGELAAA